MADIKQKPLENDVTVITGASRGIGFGIASAFAKEGSCLVLTELPEKMEDLNKAADNLKSQYNIDIITEELDITNIEQIKNVVNGVEEKFGRVDTLVNNAGVNILCDALEVTPEQWDKVLILQRKVKI